MFSGSGQRYIEACARNTTGFLSLFRIVPRGFMIVGGHILKRICRPNNQKYYDNLLKFGRTLKLRVTERCGNTYDMTWRVFQSHGSLSP
jgi:hypothetical protein